MRLAHFPAKCAEVRRRKCDKCKNLERVSDSKGTEGPGTKGTLTPGKLGKNGDQIQRLFLSPAEIFIVQYHGQIGQAVIEQMKAFATINSVREGKQICYGVIDGDDTKRLSAAYLKQF